MRCKIFHIEDPLVTPSDIITRVGCNVTSKCSAENADTVLWSPTRTGTPFMNTSTKATWVSVMGFYACIFIGGMAVLKEVMLQFLWSCEIHNSHYMVYTIIVKENFVWPGAYEPPN